MKPAAAQSYIAGNICVLSQRANRAKGEKSFEEVAAIASAGNDHRLGANEAPPAIISAYIGGYLTKVLNAVEERVGDKFDEQDEVMLKLDIHKSIPELLLDNTDRNRTSPFAFTGNKFEFRAVGSSANCANEPIQISSDPSSVLQIGNGVPQYLLLDKFQSTMFSNQLPKRPSPVDLGFH